MPYLVHIKDGAVAQEYELKDFPVSIGRLPDCTIALPSFRAARSSALRWRAP